MANVPISFGGGSGSGSDDCTGAKAQARAGYTFICSDTDDEPAAGLIADYTGDTSFTPSTGSQTAYVGGKFAPNNITIGAIPSQHNDSGNTVLSAGVTSKSYPSGWYGNAHGAQINAQSKSITPSTSAQTVSPDSGNVLTSVSVAAIPSQEYGGDVKLTAASPVSNFPASRWSLSRHYVYVEVYTWA